MSTGVALRQRVQQCLGVLEVSRIKAFRKPVIHRGEQVIGFLAFALLVPEPSETCCGTEFPGFGLLISGDCKGFVETRFGFSDIIPRQL